MSDRRFTDKPAISPGDVLGLTPSHPAMVQNRTLFPTTVVTVTETEPERLLISGHNNRKLGETVEKGRFRGYALYQLSLEERATCPTYCDVRDVCYGNGMQLARRHRIGDTEVFFARLENELSRLTETHEGVLVRLHVLGDFPSVEYVAFWTDMLESMPNLACFGYTHRRHLSSDGDDIGQAIAAAKSRHPTRFRIRWSSPSAMPDGARVIPYIPPTPVVDGHPVCPAQTDATACCATCGFCWENTDKSVLFIRHGRSVLTTAAANINEAGALSDEQVAAARRVVAKSEDRPADIDLSGSALGSKRADQTGMRPIIPLSMPASLRPARILSDRPIIRMVNISDMVIETSYQRNLTQASVKLIRKIVAEWSWSKFKPPIVAEVDGKFAVINGQHTSIAAASHPDIVALPCVIVDAKAVADRAASFVSHNMDQLRMTQHQIFLGRAIAADPVAAPLLALVNECRGLVPKTTPKRDEAVPGEIVGINKLEEFYRCHGADATRRLLTAIVKSGFAPASATVFRAWLRIFGNPAYAIITQQPTEILTASLASIDNFDDDVRAIANSASITYYMAAEQIFVAAVTRQIADEERRSA